MAAKFVTSPRSVARVQVPSVQDATTQRAFDVVTDAITNLQGKQGRTVVTANLVVGTNKVAHGLGRNCQGYTLTPTSADATFAHAIDKTNPRPDLEVWITVIGVGQTGATIEVF